MGTEGGTDEINLRFFSVGLHGEDNRQTMGDFGMSTKSRNKCGIESKVIGIRIATNK
jgi:hypothetical protein